MKFLFLVQGEGRGHMTQAIALSKILRDNGHEVVHVFIGKNKRREIPSYFFDQIEALVEPLPAPTFILDKQNKALNLLKTIGYNLLNFSIYVQSLKRIHKKVKETNPDAIINFYDILGGFYFMLFKTKKLKHICVGRQFLTCHPDYPFEKNRAVEKYNFLLNNWVTSLRCHKYLALSFRPYSPNKIDILTVTPPLLNIKKGSIFHENFILAYMVNDGYAEDLIAWHKRNKAVKIHCFWDRAEEPTSYSPHENLTFHQIDNTLFKDMLRRCSGYISTAGFESICEAMYLQKPVQMIPVERQYEQSCNAIDGEISGAGFKSSTFDVSKLLAYIPKYQPDPNFENWLKKADAVFLKELTDL